MTVVKILATNKERTFYSALDALYFIQSEALKVDEFITYHKDIS